MLPKIRKLGLGRSLVRRCPVVLATSPITHRNSRAPIDRINTRSVMSLEVIRGTSRKPASSKELDDILSSRDDLNGLLFIGHPIVRTSSGPFPIDALLISEDVGIIAFDLIEGTRCIRSCGQTGRHRQQTRLHAQNPSRLNEEAGPPGPYIYDFLRTRGDPSR